MARWKPDPTFYPRPALAGEAPAEQLAYVALLAAAANGQRDALGVVDTDPASPSVRPPGRPGRLARTAATSCTTSAGTRAARTSAPTRRNAHVERRYLVVPGTRSSRIHILDTKPDPRQPRARQGDRGATR